MHKLPYIDMVTGKRKYMDIDPNEVVKWYEDFCKRIEDKHKWIIETYHPKHIGHTQESIDMEHFDALFLQETFKCSCGEEIIIDRGMTDMADEKFKKSEA